MDKPSDTLQITYFGESRRLVMTFGLINALTGYINTPLDLIKVTNNPELQELFLYEILSDRNEDGVIVQGAKTFSLDPETAIAVINWAVGHVNHFFIQTLTKQQNQFSQLLALTSQPSGATGSQG
ncbi:hypothetical protein [Photobacterium sp. GSS17]|uniref:hypothetical protein n=1 Tax=Photobacterium sp. GSS17 TaxID=3020715 RepID=UPI00235FE72E|nr:hypothetical protein [Photobacterium sp. GSS17]